MSDKHFYPIITSETEILQLIPTKHIGKFYEIDTMQPHYINF